MSSGQIVDRRPLAVDFYCGTGGWTRGLKAAGFRVIGVDMVRFADYPGDVFIQSDVRQIDAGAFSGARLFVASPPCQGFSKHGRAGLFKNLAPPSIACVVAVRRLAKQAGVPLVMENVRAAEKFIGPAKAHYGPYYLWGDVPAMLPDWGPRRRHKSDLPDDMSRAEIPFELAFWIGRFFSPADKLSSGIPVDQVTPCPSSTNLSPWDNLSPGQPAISYQIGTPLEEFERVAIEQTLLHAEGDVNMAARLLGVTSRTIYRFLARKRSAGDILSAAGT